MQCGAGQGTLRSHMSIADALTLDKMVIKTPLCLLFAFFFRLRAMCVSMTLDYVRVRGQLGLHV